MMKTNKSLESLSDVSNYLLMVPPVAVFPDVISDIFPGLGITSSLAVLYDDLYGMDTLLICNF